MRCLAGLPKDVPVVKVDWMYELMNEKKEGFFSSRIACDYRAVRVEKYATTESQQKHLAFDPHDAQASLICKSTYFERLLRGYRESLPLIAGLLKC